jgi:hypothetical protein
MVFSRLDNRLELIRLGTLNKKMKNLQTDFFFIISVLPMGNGVNAPTGYIINGASTTNMTSSNAQLG